MLLRFATYCLMSVTITAVPSPKRGPSSEPLKTTETPLSTRVEEHIKSQLDKKYRTKIPKKKRKKRKKKSKNSTSLIVRVQRFYDNTEDLTANFIQQYTRVAISRTSESRGVVTIRKPGMMRWDYSQPETKSFIADGKTLVIYEPEEEQAIIDRNFKSSQLNSSMGFLWGNGKLADSFTVLSSKKEGTNTVLTLKPKADATYTKLTLVVETKTGRVLETKLFETAGNTNHFKFRDIKTNTKIPKSRFQFTPPPDIDVIERP